MASVVSFFKNKFKIRFSHLNTLGNIFELRQQCGMYDQQSIRSACAYAQSDQSLC